MTNKSETKQKKKLPFVCRMLDQKDIQSVSKLDLKCFGDPTTNVGTWRSHPWFCYVAIHNFKVIGFIVGSRVNDHYFVHKIAVEDKYRLRGVATELLNNVMFMKGGNWTMIPTTEDCRQFLAHLLEEKVKIDETVTFARKIKMCRVPNNN